MKQSYPASQTTVVLLAAGHGKRMLPLTKHTPKPLLKVGQHALIEHHLIRLREQGFKDIIINIAHLGEKIRTVLRSGERFDLSIQYSDESLSGPLETAGGLKNALDLISSDPFLVINADIWTDCDFTTLLKPLTKLGRLAMVKNPTHNPGGDYALAPQGNLILANTGEYQTRTFSGIAVYQKSLFASLPTGKMKLAPVFERLIQDQQLEGLAFDGNWVDVGTPARLAELNQSEKT